MRHAHRPGYLLTYILAGFPLVVAVSAVSFNLIQRALRAQRVVLVQAGNDQEAPRLVRDLRDDARAARGVEVSDDTVRLTLGGETITYVLGSGATRTRADEAGLPFERTHYALGHVMISARQEVIAGGDELVWLIFEFRAKWQPKVIDVSRWAAAARVGPEVMR